MVLKVPDKEVPIRVMLPMTTIAISPAINPYSNAVTARRSAARRAGKRAKTPSIVTVPLDKRLTFRGGRGNGSLLGRAGKPPRGRAWPPSARDNPMLINVNNRGGQFISYMTKMRPPDVRIIPDTLHPPQPLVATARHRSGSGPFGASARLSRRYFVDKSIPAAGSTNRSQREHPPFHVAAGSCNKAGRFSTGRDRKQWTPPRTGRFYPEPAATPGQTANTLRKSATSLRKQTKKDLRIAYQIVLLMVLNTLESGGPTRETPPIIARKIKTPIIAYSIEVTPRRSALRRTTKQARAPHIVSYPAEQNGHNASQNTTAPVSGRLEGGHRATVELKSS